jgi:type II secretory pathway component PulF
MPLIVTPGQFTRRAEFYHQLAQLTSAGLGPVPALEQLRQNPPADSFREPIQRMLAQLTAGCTFTESLQGAGQWLPAFDIALLQAGEQSGRLDACFTLLADYYYERACVARQMIADLAYPVFLLHFAVFILPFAQFFVSGNLAAYLAKTFGVLLPIYAVVALLIYAAQGKHGENWRALVESVLHSVPVLGSARRYLALARLAASLEALISAGMSITEAWELAATASGSPALRRAVQAWKPKLLAGQTPAEALGACPQFPQLFANLYTTGEVSGKLDDSMRQLHRIYQEDGTRKLHAVAQWVPRIIYLIIVLVIAYYIINFWMGHFGQIREAVEF